MELTHALHTYTYTYITHLHLHALHTYTYMHYTLTLTHALHTYTYMHYTLTLTLTHELYYCVVVENPPRCTVDKYLECGRPALGNNIIEVDRCMFG